MKSNLKFMLLGTSPKCIFGMNQCGPMKSSNRLTIMTKMEKRFTMETNGVQNDERLGGNATHFRLIKKTAVHKKINLFLLFMKLHIANTKFPIIFVKQLRKTI